jgi:hypothetical protein
MRRELFMSIVDRVCAFDPWFVQRPDALGRMGLSSLQKCTAAVRMLVYGVAADGTDKYVRLGASTAHEALVVSVLPFEVVSSPLICDSRPGKT